MTKAIDFMQDLAVKIREQDNACTSYPIYTVQKQVRVTGFDTGYSDNVVWIDSDHEIVRHEADRYPDDDGPSHEDLECMHCAGDETPEGYTRTGYHDNWEMIEVFMTHSAANTFIQANRHRYSGKLRVYVESAHRNPELRELRRLLSGPISECLKVLAYISLYIEPTNVDADTIIKAARGAIASLDTHQDPYR